MTDQPQPLTAEEVTKVRDNGYPYGQQDARKWADEFDRIFPGVMDKGTMLGWFANAIETGAARAAQPSEGLREALLREALRDAVALVPPERVHLLRQLTLAALGPEARAALAATSSVPPSEPSLAAEVRDYIHRQVGLAAMEHGAAWREKADPYLVRAVRALTPSPSGGDPR